jgi:hypothetical protein
LQAKVSSIPFSPLLDRLEALDYFLENFTVVLKTILERDFIAEWKHLKNSKHN